MKWLGCAFALLVMFHTATFAQMDSLWFRTYGTAFTEFGRAIHQTTDGGFIVGGYQDLGAPNGQNFWIVKTNANGDTLWTRNFGGPGTDQCWSVRQTSDGGYVLAGFATPSSLQFSMVKTDAGGNLLWFRHFGGAGDENCNAVIETSDGGYALAGTTTSAGSSDFWLVRTNANGDSLWSRRYGGASYDACTSVRQTPDGGFILAGTTQSYGAGSNDFWAVRTNAGGDSLWSRTYGTVNSEGCSSVDLTPDGGYIFAGEESPPASLQNFLVVKTDGLGNPQWSRSYGGSGLDICRRAQPTPDGGYLLGGHTTSYGSGGTDYWVLKINAGGDSLWNRTMGSPSVETSWAAQITADGGYVVAGHSGASGSLDFGVARFFSSEPPALTSIEDVGNDQGRRVRLRWNRAGYDRANPRHTVTGYSIYRRVDQYLMGEDRPRPNPALDWPPGEWDFVATVPAFGEETYTAIAPTLADSTSDGVYWSAFFIRAATSAPTVFMDSPVDSGYSMDNLAPDPTLLVANVTLQGGNLVLHWQEVTTGGGGQPELNGVWYRVHGATDPNFVPGESNLLTATQQLSYAMPLTENRFYFKVLVSDGH